MNWLVLGLLAIGIFVGLGILTTPIPGISRETDGYASKKPLSDPEQVLFWRLREALPECVVLSQVSFSRFLEPVAVSPEARRRDLNRISQKSADFLVCLPDFTTVAVVELDDRSHRSTKDQRRDAIVNSANVPVVRLHVGDMPPTEQLRSLFLK